MRISDWSSDVCSSDLITGVLCMAYTQPAFAQEKRGVIPHAPLLRTAVPDTANQEVAVYHVEYEPGGINPRHLHPAAVTFHIDRKSVVLGKSVSLSVALGGLRIITKNIQI